jgi:multicomponent Na+:H+ antiporter subunit E
VSYFALNLVLSLIWMLLTGNFTLWGFVTGFIAGYIGLAFAQPVLGSREYVRALRGMLTLVAVFVYELVVANLQLARDLLRPEMPFQPGFVSFDARDLGPSETVLLALMISLTPGTLSVDLDDLGNVLHIHSIYTRDTAALQRGFRRFANLIHGAQGVEGPYPEVS